MSLRRQLEEAAERLDVASAQLVDLRARGGAPEELREWLEALGEMTLALSDIQALNNESIHEKLHAIASRLGMEGDL